MILGIEGSPRKAGNSHKMLQAVLEGAAGAGQETRDVHLRDYRYDPCVGCEACRKDKICTRFNDGMTLLYPQIEASAGLVMITPVHNYNVTSWIKAFIDRMYCYYDFEDTRPRAWSSRLAGQGRKAVIGAIAEQESEADMGFAMDAMRLPLTAMGFEIVEELPILRLFDRGVIARHEELIERARKAGETLAQAL